MKATPRMIEISKTKRVLKSERGTRIKTAMIMKDPS